MSETLRNEPENENYVNVPVAGFEQPIRVLLAHDQEKLPQGMAVLAPDTRNAKVLVTIDRGRNAYGSLREDFFVCRDGDFEYNGTILWMSINADQAQDSVQRLEPFCMLAAGWQPDEIEEKTASLMEDFDPLEFEGLILLWAYVHYATSSWGREFLDEAMVNAGLLNEHVAGVVLQAGMNGNPVDFSWLSSA